MGIELLVVDADGTLTDGSILYGPGDVELKKFSVKDGLILKAMPKLGIEVLILTGRSSDAIKRRAAELGCALVENAKDKLDILQEHIKSKSLVWNNIAYIGDDLNDYAAMKKCRFKACPSDAAAEIIEICDFVSVSNGGYGAVRNICEQLLKLESKFEDFLKLYCAEKQ